MYSQSGAKPENSTKIYTSNEKKQQKSNNYVSNHASPRQDYHFTIKEQ